jgi:hypothetical protein
LWTGRTAPYRVMKDVVLENCMPKEEAFQWIVLRSVWKAVTVGEADSRIDMH